VGSSPPEDDSERCRGEVGSGEAGEGEPGVGESGLENSESSS